MFFATLAGVAQAPTCATRPRISSAGASSNSTMKCVCLPRTSLPHFEQCAARHNQYLQRQDVKHVEHFVGPRRVLAGLEPVEELQPHGGAPRQPYNGA